eukprot:1620577-Pleurochrysis_carterae.AAC.1
MHGPMGRRRRQREAASAGRRDAGWPRTKANYRRGTRMARLSTSPTSHHPPVSPTGRWQAPSG